MFDMLLNTSMKFHDKISSDKPFFNKQSNKTQKKVEIGLKLR